MSLQSALTTRAVIDQAVGVLISRNGITAGEALTELRRRSQAEHRPVSAVAAEIVEGAVRRARARRKGN
jgi:AmiR/NasT family two-component response regulator